MKPIQQATEKPLECPIPHGKRNRIMVWIKRLGLAGFLFFLIKGLIWIAIFIFGVEAIKNIF